MKAWLKNIKTGEIVCAFRLPRGYSIREAVNNWLRDNNITDVKNYKILYKNPYY